MRYKRFLRIKMILQKGLRYLQTMRALQRVNIALAKGNIAKNARVLNENDPKSWEFSGFSQNGEDGMLSFLTSKLLASNQKFIEIGAADGLENNLSWHAIVHKWQGVMI